MIITTEKTLGLDLAMYHMYLTSISLKQMK